MIRRPKSLERSRRIPVLARCRPVRPLQPFSPARLPDDLPPDVDPLQNLSGEQASTPVSAPAHPVVPYDRSTPQPPPIPAPAGHAPTGWDWFAQWSFPTQFFLFSSVIAIGMGWMNRPPPPVAVDPPPVARAAAHPRPRVRPETFDWLNRLRETQVVTDQLETEFAEAQGFYREYALDEFLDFDPWSIGSDEVVALTHFCDQGFFTVEREILIKILERKLIDHADVQDPVPRGAAARLEAAARNRESRLTSLREAAEMYRRGREAEVTIPGALTPEDDQAQRAQLVDKLAAVRRDRARLDTRIDDLNSLLR